MNINTIHDRFVEYGKNAKEWIRQCQLLLPEIQRYRVWEAKGFSSIYVYSYKLAGLNERQVDVALWTLEKLADKPALYKVAQTKGINAVIPAAKIATKETDKFWAEKAEKLNQAELKTYVQEYRHNLIESKNLAQSFVNERSQQETVVHASTNNGSKQPSLQNTESQVSSQSSLAYHHGNINNISSDNIIKLQQIDPNLNKAIEILLHIKEQYEQTKPKSVKTNSRHIPNKIKKFVLTKYNHKCGFPNCSKSYKILHHINRFALHHTHDPDKIIPLCKEHEQLVHQGLVDESTWQIRDYPDYLDLNIVIDANVQHYRQKFRHGCESNNEPTMRVL